MDGYGLSLSDGRKWWISSAGGEINSADQMASMMGLRKCTANGSTRLIFSITDGIDDTKNGLNGVIDTTQIISAGSWIAHDHEVVRLWQHNPMNHAICEIIDPAIGRADICFSCQAIYQQSMKHGGMPLHAALAEFSGRGVLMLAPPGTGKTTCCRRLPAHWKDLCDDETLVVLDKQNQYRAHPFPTWSECLTNRSERAWNVQYSVPVVGAFFLEQAQKDEVVPIGRGQATVLMSSAATHVWTKYMRKMELREQGKFRADIFRNACKMMEIVPSFLLRVSLCGRFWEEIEAVLK